MNLEPPNEAQLQFIKKEEFYRPPEKLDEDVTQLIKWLTKQPHLPNITDRKWLTHFITGCKFNLQKSKQVIESYFIVRAELPEFFGSITREELEASIKCGMMSVLPKLTPEGYRVCCYKSRPIVDKDTFDAKQFCRTTLFLMDLELRQEAPYGYVAIFDQKYLTLYQQLKFTPTLTKNFVRCIFDSFPTRVRAIHFLHPPIFIDSFLKFFKMFLPKKIKERIYIHYTLESLHQNVSKEVLPEVYGGTSGDIEKLENDIIEYLVANKEWLEARPKADLSKCSVHKKPNALDMNGTFKKLEID